MKSYAIKDVPQYCLKCYHCVINNNFRPVCSEDSYNINGESLSGVYLTDLVVAKCKLTNRKKKDFRFFRKVIHIDPIAFKVKGRKA